MTNPTFQIDPPDSLNFRNLGEQLQYLARLLTDSLTISLYGEDDFPEENKPNMEMEFKRALRRLSGDTICMLMCAIRNVEIVRRNDESWRLRIAHRLLNRNPKPRHKERDAKIVRLHDEKGMSFGEIGRHLPTINRAWTRSDGRPLLNVRSSFKSESPMHLIA